MPYGRIRRFQNDKPLFGKTLATQYPIAYRQHLPPHVIEYNRCTKHVKNHQQLKIMTLNINGAYLEKTKPQSRLYAYISRVHPDICILIDTRLDTAAPPIPGYGIHQILAENGQCGIIALINAKWFPQTIKVQATSSRILILDIPREKLTIVGVYLPPYAGANSTFATHLRKVVETFQEYQHIGYKVIALGDWNATHPAYPRRHSTPNDTALKHVSQLYNIQPLPIQQTSHDNTCNPTPYTWSGFRNNKLATSIIDYACTDTNRFWRVRSPYTLIDHVELGTDHHPIHTVIPHVTSAKPTPNIYIPPFHFKTNVSAIPLLCTLVYLVRHLLTRFLKYLIRTSENKRQAADLMYEVIVAFIVIMALKAGAFTVQLTNDEEGMRPTCPMAIIKLAKQELGLKHRLLATESEAETTKLMGELRETVRARESQYLRFEIEAILGSNIETEEKVRTRDFKAFWAKLNPMEMTQHYFEEQKGDNVIVNPDSRHQCNIIRQAYNKLLNPARPEPPLKVPRNMTYPQPENRNFTFPELIVVILFKQYSKEGMDAIPMRLLAAIIKISPSPFLVFFNFLYWSDIVPLKMAAERARLLPKKPVVPDPMQTRMIGVGNSLMNVYDGLHCERIGKALEEHMTGYVGGARKGRNIQDIIFLIRHSMWYAYRNHQTLILSSTDMKKCFDTIPHNWIGEEMKQVMGNGHTTAYVAAQLKDRRINLQWQGVMMEPIETTVGTPQGRQVSGPITNTVFKKAPVKALATGVGFEAATIPLPMTSYMDDMLSETTNVPATLTIHRELDSVLTDYAMSFNDSKHMILVITTAAPADLNDLIEKIKKVFPTATVQPATMRHLGAQYAYQDFNFNAFFKIAFGSMLSKHKAIRLKGIFNGAVGPCSVKQIYVGLLRPVAAFICPVQPLTHRNYKKLKGFQNKTLKKALQLPISASKDLIHLVLGVPKLKTFLNLMKFQWFTSRRFAKPNSHRYKLLQQTLISEWDQLRASWLEDQCTKEKKMRMCVTYEICVIARKYGFVKQFTHFLDSNVNTNDSGAIKRKVTEYQMVIRETDWNKSLKGSQLKKSPIKRYILARCHDEFVKWKQFTKKYPRLIDWKRVNSRRLAADYFARSKHPFALPLIEELFNAKWLTLPNSGQTAQAYFSILFGWQQMQYRKCGRNKKCPMCGDKFIKPANHVLYLCLLTHEFHMPQKLAAVLDEEENIRDAIPLARNEIAPGYTPNRLWKLATKVAVRKEWWRTKDKDPDIEWEKDLKEMVRAMNN